MDNKNIDKSRLTLDQQAQLEAYQQREQQLIKLEDIAVMVQNLITDTDGKKELAAVDKLGVLLVDIRESLSSLNAKEAPETPDFAKPVVDAVMRLEQALSASLKAIDVKPQVTVAAPNVQVDAPIVDLSKVEKVLATLPKAFEDAIKLIPKTEIPKDDYTPLLNAWNGIAKQLDSIDTATRLKPQFPTQLKVVNPDGTNVGGGATTADYSVNDIEEATASYFGYTKPNGTWLVKSLTATSVAYATVSNNGAVTSYTDAWTARATLTYGRFDEAF